MRRNSLSGCDLIATPFKLCAHGHFLPFLYHIVLPEHARLYTVTKYDMEART